MTKAGRDNLGSLLPQLSSAELEALKADIKTHGVRMPVDVDESGIVLDGRHRLKIDPRAPRRIVRGLTPAEKEAHVFRSNLARRNLSPEQKGALLKRMKATAFALRAEDAKKNTQARVAALLGVSQPTVVSWFMHNISADNTHKPKPDARVTLTEAAQEKAAERIKAGEPQARVAADYKVAQSTVSRAVAKAQKRAVKAAVQGRAERKAAKLDVKGLYHEDFRKTAKRLPSESVALIFTDPPYDRKSVGLYAEAAEIATRVLIPGGSFMAYCGQYLLSTVLQACAGHLRLWWVCACLHGGKFARMREYGIVVNWKPIVWFTKGARRDVRTFVADAVSGQREKETHRWQQAEAEAAYYIEKLTKPGELVFDPFCGGGTTAVVCAKLGRRYVSCDTDAAAIASAKMRLAKVLS